MSFDKFDELKIRHAAPDDSGAESGAERTPVLIDIAEIADELNDNFVNLWDQIRENNLDRGAIEQGLLELLPGKLNGELPESKLILAKFLSAILNGTGSGNLPTNLDEVRRVHQVFEDELDLIEDNPSSYHIVGEESADSESKPGEPPEDAVETASESGESDYQPPKSLWFWPGRKSMHDSFPGWNYRGIKFSNPKHLFELNDEELVRIIKGLAYSKKEDKYNSDENVSGVGQIYAWFKTAQSLQKTRESYKNFSAQQLIDAEKIKSEFADRSVRYISDHLDKIKAEFLYDDISESRKLEILAEIEVLEQFVNEKLKDRVVTEEQLQDRGIESGQLVVYMGHDGYIKLGEYDRVSSSGKARLAEPGGKEHWEDPSHLFLLDPPPQQWVDKVESLEGNTERVKLLYSQFLTDFIESGDRRDFGRLRNILIYPERYLSPPVEQFDYSDLYGKLIEADKLDLAKALDSQYRKAADKEGHLEDFEKSPVWFMRNWIQGRRSKIDNADDQKVIKLLESQIEKVQVFIDQLQSAIDGLYASKGSDSDDSESEGIEERGQAEDVPATSGELRGVVESERAENTIETEEVDLINRLSLKQVEKLLEGELQEKFRTYVGNLDLAEGDSEGGKSIGDLVELATSQKDNGALKILAEVIQQLRVQIPISPLFAKLIDDKYKSSEAGEFEEVTLDRLKLKQSSAIEGKNGEGRGEDYVVVGEGFQIVLDGVGSELGSDESSKRVGDFVAGQLQKIINDGLSGRELKSALIESYKRSIEYAVADNGQPAATTLSIAVIEQREDGAYLTTMNLGDSRTYLIRDQVVKFMTVDDVLADTDDRDLARKLEIQKILAEVKTDADLDEADVEELGLKYLFGARNQINTYLSGDLEPDQFIPRVESVKVENGDLILSTSDGIHDPLTTTEILDTVKIARDNNQDIAKALLDRVKIANLEPEEFNKRVKPDDKAIAVLEIGESIEESGDDSVPEQSLFSLQPTERQVVMASESELADLGIDLATYKDINRRFLPELFEVVNDESAVENLVQFMNFLIIKFRDPFTDLSLREGVKKAIGEFFSDPDSALPKIKALKDWFDNPN